MCFALQKKCLRQQKMNKAMSCFATTKKVRIIYTTLPLFSSVTFFLLFQDQAKDLSVFARKF